MSTSFKSAPTKQRLGRQASVAVSCEKKSSFAKKTVQTVAAAVVSVGLVTGSTTYAYDNPNTKGFVWMMEFSPEAGNYQPVKGDRQEEFQKMKQRQLDQVYGKVDVNAPEIQKILKASKDNEEYLDRFRKVKTYAAFARAQQGQTGFEECSFPNNFFGCDGKFAKNKWIKEQRQMEREVDSKLGYRTSNAVAFGALTNSFPK